MGWRKQTDMWGFSWEGREMAMSINYFVGIWINCYNQGMNLKYIYPLTQPPAFRKLIVKTGLVDKQIRLTRTFPAMLK